LAFQALYAWDVSKLSLSELLNFGWIEDEKRERLGEDGIAFPRLIIAGAIEHMDEIDLLIKENVTNWDFDRLNRVDLAILRMSVYSLLYQTDLHPSIVIDEAIDISKEFASDDSFRFVNAVLDSIRKKLPGSSVKCGRDGRRGAHRNGFCVCAYIRSCASFSFFPVPAKTLLRHFYRLWSGLTG